ncbi:RNA chaperone Hfq [Bacillus toyonensis]|uniref:RNA chaperone Hfq n=1 Tax=Bacillus toyonensis TaxID=155322 RepID=UPI000C01344F|nr:RNA chaperone Hfq [Bacillus toyonensis]PGA90468.1 RNA chaperone Hfq [Bacillus toyonensis]
METKLQAFQKGRSKNMLSLQEQLLQEAFQKRKDITLILLKGLHVKGMIKGMIRGFDTYSVLMEFEGKQQLIYKHAISTIRF